MLEIKNQLIAHLREKDKNHKEPQYLWDHLIGVSKLAGRFASKIGLKETGEILGLLHDLGKASQEFQNYILSGEGLINPDADEYIDPQAKKGKIDHSTAGAQLLEKKLPSKGAAGRYTAKALSLAIVSHHSGLIDCITPPGEDNFTRRIQKKDEDTHLTEALQRLPKIEKLLDEILVQPIEQQFLRKLKGMQEDDNEEKVTLAFKHGLLARFLLSCLLDADRLNTADFEFPENEVLRNYGKYHPWEILIERLEIELRSLQEKSVQNHVTELRAQVSQACLDFAAKPKGICQLTVPTGGGKTLASLRFALHHAKTYGMDRIIYVVPYITIIDQNADRVREILEDKDENDKYLDNVILEHHSDLTPEEETKRHNLLAENWDAPIIFTTQVQFLETLFGSGTRNARRMHQLANAVIILDEVQTLPVRCVQMLNMAIRFLTHDCGSTVVLCTATQPPLDKIGNYRQLVIESDNRIIANEKELFQELQRVEVFDKRKPGGWQEDEVADLAEEALQARGSVLIVVNTKSAARSLYQLIVSRNIASTYHLSTNMCPAHRRDILNKVKEKLDAGESIICISTQLIEAGVDIDFGAVIRYLAGLDSIAQSAGRCNRHGKRKENGYVYVVNPANENLSRLQDIQDGSQIASGVLTNYQKDSAKFDDDIIGIEAIAAYYQGYFQRRENDLEYPIKKESILSRNDTLFNLLSRNTQAAGAGRAKDFLMQSFQSAARLFQVIDSHTVGIIVPYKEGKEIITALCGEIDLREQRDLLKKAQRYSVNLFDHQFKELSRKHVIYETHNGKENSSVFYLDKQYYDDKFGWSEEIVNDPGLLIVEGGS